MTTGAFERWIESLEERYLRDLRFADVSRALRALSSAYVERRSQLDRGTALAGAGKRAAFALFYAPIHFLLIRHVVGQLPNAIEMRALVDLGCGTGAAGAAWASLCAHSPAITAIDRHPWAIEEAARTYRAFDLRARLQRADIRTASLPRSPVAIVAAYALNELIDAEREQVLTRLLAHAARGDRLLVVEPLAGSAAPWWPRWRERVEQAGGRADEWRIRIELPPIVEKLDRAAGLDHRELTGRSLWLAKLT